MAKKKKEDAPAPGSPAWMATFSDLMNLLLCFFVLLFSMSSVDGGKAEALIQSLAHTFSIFDAGGSSFGEGNMISNGADQLTELDEYFNTMGKTDDGDIDQNINNSENGSESGDSVAEGPLISATPTLSPTMTPDQIIKEDNKEQSELLYGEVSDLLNKFNLTDFVDIGIDSNQYQYIVIEIKGHVLFDKGDAKLLEDAKPIVSKIGDILKQYSGYKVEIIGHTDSVPQTKAPYYNNYILSTWRALSVAQYLAENKNIGWENVHYEGRADLEKVASDDTEDGRKQNRRVEIRLYNKKNSEK